MHCFRSSEWNSKRRSAARCSSSERGGPDCRLRCTGALCEAPAPMRPSEAACMELRSVQLGELE
eukprot:1913142-Alexandrium_andersonii.AAC.1